MRRPDSATQVEGDTGSELDELIDQWTQDRNAVQRRALELIRVGHVVSAPVVIGGLFVVNPDSGLVVAGLFYCLGMAAGLTVLPRRAQAGVLAIFDILLIGHVSATDPAVWMGLLTPCLAAMTIGWLISARVTWLLWLAAVGSMGAAAAISAPLGGFYTWLVFAVSTAVLNFIQLTLLAHRRDSVLRVTDLVDSLPVIVWETEETNGGLTRAVGRVEDLLGFSVADWRALPVEERVHPGDLGSYVLDPADMRDREVVREVRLLCADGADLRVREVVRGVEFRDRLVLRGVILDIAEEAAARETVDRLAAVVANQTEPLLVIAPRETVAENPQVLQANPAFGELVGRDNGDAAGAELGHVAPWLPPSVRDDLDAVMTTEEVVDRREVELATPGGRRCFDYCLVPLPDGAVGVQFTDVTERKNATELIRHQAFHDPLTGLPNRTLFFDRLSQALAVVRREHTKVGLLLLDLNQFKEINDTLGHAYGDELLAVVGERLRALTRDVDTVARLGGDEFAIVVSNADEASLHQAAERVHAEVSRAIELRGIEVEVTASIGGAVAPVHGEDAQMLMQRADVAMYDAKRSGIGYRLYVRDDDRHSLDRLTLMGELRRLIEGELEVWFQPKIDLRTGRADELEALARWNHPRLGLLEPRDFIELCEVSGLVGELTFAVLEQALGVAAGWPGLRVAVNVPVRNLYDRSLPSTVGDILDRHGVDADRLILEITEREIMEDHRAILEVLEELHRRGVRLSIDDFGTGFSSLTHLRRLPIQEIKIDQSFIFGMLDRENDYIIARSIIDLAHNLGHRVVAEGVEDMSTLDLLRELGCDVAQGFLFARPGPIERIRNRILTGPALHPDGALAWAGRE